MKKINLFDSLIFLLLMLIPFIPIPDYAIGHTINNLLLVYKLGVILLILVFYIKRGKLSKIMGLIILLQSTFFLATVLNKNYGDIKTFINQYVSIIALCMFSEMAIKENPKQFFKAMMLYVGFLSLVNTYTFFKYKGSGMYRDYLGHTSYYFLGYDNTTFYTIFPSVIYVALYFFLDKKRKFWWPFWYTLIIFLGFYYVNSTTSFVMLALFIGFLILLKLKKIPKFFSYKKMMVLVFIICIMIVLFNAQYYFQDILVNVFHKNVTLTGRTQIWQRAISYIKESWLIGYGLETDVVLLAKFGINHVHNFLLDIIYEGGIIALTIFIIMLKTIGNNLKKYQDSDIAKILIAGFFIFFLAGIFDYYNSKYLMFTLYVVAFYVDKIITFYNERGIYEENQK